jgi:phage-related protein
MIKRYGVRMFGIIFYRDKRGKQPIVEYLQKLKKECQANKNSRINFHKINDYMQLLAKNGTNLGMPYTKKIQGQIWELRPLRNRIFFFCGLNKKIILLHYFIKKTQKTPLHEIQQAQKNMEKYLQESQNEKKEYPRRQ